MQTMLVISWPVSKYPVVMFKQSLKQGKIDTTAVAGGRAPLPPNYILGKSQPTHVTQLVAVLEANSQVSRASKTNIV